MPANFPWEGESREAFFNAQLEADLREREAQSARPLPAAQSGYGGRQTGSAARCPWWFLLIVWAVIGYELTHRSFLTEGLWSGFFAFAAVIAGLRFTFITAKWYAWIILVPLAIIGLAVVSSLCAP